MGPGFTAEVIAVVDNYTRLMTCKNCNLWKQHHTKEGMKCLFGPGTFEPYDKLNK
jgi:hypothetical protein